MAKSTKKKPAASKKPPKAAENLREKILAAAIELLRTEGPGSFSQPRVAKAAGIPQGHLTYYFPKKADLLEAIARHFDEMCRREMLGLAARLFAGEGKRAVMEFTAGMIQDEGRTRTLLALLIASEGDEALKKKLRTIALEPRPQLAALLGLAPEDPIGDLVMAVHWGLEVQQLLFHRKPHEVNALVETLVGWFERARTPHGKEGGVA